MLAVGLIIVVIGLALVLWGWAALTGNGTNGDLDNDGAGIASFEECEEAGYPVMESFPRRCQTPDGTTFIEGGGIEEPDTTVEGASNIQTPAGTLSLAYEDGFLRLEGTLQRNESCINWEVDTQTDGRAQAAQITFDVHAERTGEVCAQVISQQQINTIVRAVPDAAVRVIFEGDVVLDGSLDSNGANGAY